MVLSAEDISTIVEYDESEESVKEIRTSYLWGGQSKCCERYRKITRGNRELSDACRYDRPSNVDNVALEELLKGRRDSEASSRDKSSYTSINIHL